ncbi:MAG: rhodanese-related sulfurtransferase [Cellvibrionaceae bacterium]
MQVDCQQPSEVLGIYNNVGLNQVCEQLDDMFSGVLKDIVKDKNVAVNKSSSRDAEIYATGHIPGAVNIPDVFFFLAESSPEVLAEMRETFKKEFSAVGLDGSKAAIICEDSLNTRYGGSCCGWWVLKYFGCPMAGVLDGGVSAWKEKGYAMTTEATETVAADFPLNVQKACWSVSKKCWTRFTMIASLNSIIAIKTNCWVKVLPLTAKILSLAKAACLMRYGWSGMDLWRSGWHYSVRITRKNREFDEYPWRFARSRYHYLLL